MSTTNTGSPLRLALPKGRMQGEVFALLEAAGLRVRTGARAYRPTIAGVTSNAKILKPQNIVEMLAANLRDVGFAGADWVAELGADVVELLDTGLDPVRLVAAAPTALLTGEPLRNRRGLVIASEYPQLTRKWVASERIDAQVIRSYGATEVFPPEDADLIVDNTATGSTLAANGLDIVDVLLESSTRFYANPRALDDATSRGAIEDLVMLLRSVLDARQRVTLEVNIASDRLDAICALLPCMREPTISPLHGGVGFAVKAAVPRNAVPALIPAIKAAGGTDILISSPTQLVS